jgi:hypothetical protein
MRFAILGDHRDGWAVARALVASGRHELIRYQGPTPAEMLREDWPGLRHTSDLEDVLADPQVEAVIVAGKPGERLDQLRRVLQSERSAFCVHPVDQKPDGAYEMNLLQGDTHQIVMPVLPEALHPQVESARQRLFSHGETSAAPILLDVEHRGVATLMFEGVESELGPSFPGWALLRQLGGEVEEVVGFAAGEQVTRAESVLVQGRSSRFLFRVLYRPSRTALPPLTKVTFLSDGPDEQTLAFDPSDWGDSAWRSLVECFESAVGRLKTTPRATPGSGPIGTGHGLSWQDEIRALELDDAVRRSIERRRAYTLEYQESGEDVGFKGTMTLVGCALIWLIPVLLLASAAFPQLGWLIVPVLLGFLGLQLLRWLVPSPTHPPDNKSAWNHE